MNRVLDKLYKVSKELHEMEDKREELSSEEDELWFQLTALILEYEEIKERER